MDNHASSSSSSRSKASIATNNALKAIDDTDKRFDESSESCIGLDQLPRVSIDTRAAHVEGEVKRRTTTHEQDYAHKLLL